MILKTETTTGSQNTNMETDGEDIETPCPESPDNLHCNHWYDGDFCCFCDDPELFTLRTV